jgi:hypothetical protein
MLESRPRVSSGMQQLLLQIAKRLSPVLSITPGSEQVRATIERDGIQGKAAEELKPDQTRM